MECPLTLYPAGTLGTVDYYASCACVKMCTYTKCKYRTCGFIVKFSSLGSTATNTVALLGKACGGSFPLVAASDNDAVTNANLTAGQTYTVVPVTINGVLRGVVQGL